jgi:hypothetical protein
MLKRQNGGRKKDVAKICKNLQKTAKHAGMVMQKSAKKWVSMGGKRSPK